MIPQRIRPWWSYIQASAQRHGLDPYVLAAMMDRESLGGHALEPPGPAGFGDNGNALGLMQIDKRYHADWAARKSPDGTPLWQLPEENIEYGAKYLAGLQKEFAIEGAAAWACAVAAYNAGPGKVQKVLNEITRPCTYDQRLECVDVVTEHGNYLQDVIDRRTQFMLPEHKTNKPPPPKPGVQ